jgi:hypothetical protein
MPQMATADRGFFSARNEHEAQAPGVEKAAPSLIEDARGRAETTLVTTNPTVAGRM